MRSFANSLVAATVGPVSVRPQGDIPVIARLVDESGREEWIIARAIRWTATAVLVTWNVPPATPGERATYELHWLAASDVARSLRPPSGKAWAAVHPARTGGTSS